MSDRDATPINTSRELVAVAISALRGNGYSISAEAIEEFAREYDSLAAKLAEAERERDDALNAALTQLRKEFEQAASDAVKAAVEAERDACAKTADDYAAMCDAEAKAEQAKPMAEFYEREFMRNIAKRTGAEIVARAIRARSSAPPVPAPIDEMVRAKRERCAATIPLTPTDEDVEAMARALWNCIQQDWDGSGPSSPSDSEREGCRKDARAAYTALVARYSGGQG